MTLSDLSVKRPVFAAVAAIVLCVIGVAAFFTLPVRELPSIDPPVVSIETDYTGASAEVIEQRITQVIEQQVAGIQGIDVVNSSSRDGISRINITFTLDRDLDGAANDVRDAVSHVANQLPIDAKPPQISKASANASSILFLAFTSSKLSQLQLADYANQYLVARLSTIPGVGQVRMSGAGLYSMRIWLDPDAMAARGITVDDVQNALNAQNVELPAGALESKAKDYTIRVNRQYNTPAEFAALPTVAARGSTSGSAASSFAAPSPTSSSAVTATARGANSQMPTVGAQLPNAQSGSNYIVRLGDIARVEEGPDDRRNYFEVSGQREVGMSVTGQAQANNLQISNDTRKMIKEINASLPPGTALKIVVDYSQFTSDAIQEVWITMGIALALVALVNFLFLGSWRAAIIPAVVAPICIVSTFTVLAVLGFSINLLSLLALVLAIGLVVDDAIVVVENVQRHVDEGEPPAVAAQRGAKQVFFAVVATTIVLIAVFAPLMVLPGYIGRLFVELAVTVAAAVFFSALMALSLSPMLGSKLLKPATGEGIFARTVDRIMEGVKRSYSASLEMLLGHRLATLLTIVVVVSLAALAGGLFLALPKELVPNEDRGRVDLSIQGPEGQGFDYTLAAVHQAEPYFEGLRQKSVLTDYLFAVPAFGNAQFNTAFGTTVMTDWRKRTLTADDLAAQINKKLASITSTQFVAAVRGPFSRGGQSGSNVDLIVSGDDYDQINKWMQPILKAAKANPGLARPRIDYEPTSPRLLVDIDHDKAAALGVSAQEIGSALQIMFGSKQVTTYVKGGQEYYVTLQTDLDKRRTVEDLDRLTVRTGSGSLVPLSNVVKTEVRGDTPDRERVDRIRSITLTQQLNPGYTVAEAVKFYQDLAAKQPPGMLIKWGGQAKDYLEASNAVALAFGGALLLVFLALAAQFESWIHPAIIMLTVPLAALGGLFGLLIAGSSINTYSEIGLIILIGIAAKNGILIVEFANQLRDDGRSVHDAVIEAAALRLRPIVMTSISAAFGALPLILAAGPGAGSRKTIGVTVFTGAIFSTLLTLFVVPVFYNLLARFTRSPEWTAKQIEAYEEEERARGAAPEPTPAE
ncbi:MAG TPA: efflux RND transporter permease subunit [Caulobacteraceae bacterium]|jgi:multidrug efflux pump|nr:efflux RND transporter permease subunit [Caulobacteraceae bacterium]